MMGRQEEATAGARHGTGWNWGKAIVTGDTGWGADAVEVVGGRLRQWSEIAFILFETATRVCSTTILYSSCVEPWSPTMCMGVCVMCPWRPA